MEVKEVLAVHAGGTRFGRSLTRQKAVKRLFKLPTIGPLSRNKQTMFDTIN